MTPERCHPEERCHMCDAPMADHSAHIRDPFDGWSCVDPPVDWRARCLDAEAKLREAEAELVDTRDAADETCLEERKRREAAEALVSKLLPRCGTWIEATETDCDEPVIGENMASRCAAHAHLESPDDVPLGFETHHVPELRAWLAAGGRLPTEEGK
jgi:hypothetical protein